MPEKEEYEWGTEEFNRISVFMREQNFGDFRALCIAASWIGTLMGAQVAKGNVPRAEAEVLLKSMIGIMETSFAKGITATGSPETRDN